MDLAANAIVGVVVDHRMEPDRDPAAQTGWVATVLAVKMRNYHMTAAEGESAVDHTIAAVDLDSRHKPFERRTGPDSVRHMTAVFRVADVGQ